MDTPSFLSMFSAPMQATSCFLVPASLASQTEDFTRVAAAIFSQIMRPLFLLLYLFQVASRREYERLRLRSWVLYLSSIDLATCSQILRPLAMDLAWALESFCLRCLSARAVVRPWLICMVLRSFSSLVLRRACSFWNLASAVAMCFMSSSDLPRNFTQARRRARAEPARASAACCFLRHRSILRRDLATHLRRRTSTREIWRAALPLPAWYATLSAPSFRALTRSEPMSLRTLRRHTCRCWSSLARMTLSFARMLCSAIMRECFLARSAFCSLERPFTLMPARASCLWALVSFIARRCCFSISWLRWRVRRWTWP